MSIYTNIHHVSNIELKEITLLDTGTYTRYIVVTTDDGIFTLTLFSDDYKNLSIKIPNS
jgi:hypothetical protein